MSTTTTVIDGKLTLYSYVDKSKRERVSVCAVLPSHDYDNERICILNWKMDAQNNGTATDSVVLTYQTRNDVCAPIHDGRFAVCQDRFPINPPSKSKNWRWSDWLGADGGYINNKTGEKCYA